MRQEKRKIKLVKGTFQMKLLIFVFLASVIPAVIVGGCLYYLIFNLLAYQIGIPETIGYILIPVLQRVNVVIMIALPIVLIIIWLVALELSHRIAGPIFRMEKELDLRIAGKASGPIKLRKKDELKNLAEKINQLIK